jgi:hypothetical protein
LKRNQGSDNQISLGFEKGFNPTLFGCIDIALASLLGGESVSVFYYAITASSGISSFEFEKPLMVLQYLEKLIGPTGFRSMEQTIVTQVEITFQIDVAKWVPLSQAIQLAKDAYLSLE